MCQQDIEIRGCEFYSLETNLCRKTEFGDGTLHFLVMSHMA